MSKKNEVLGFSRIKNKVKRNAFDLSRRHMFTAQIGEILPIFYQWVNPYETFKLGYNGKTRTASLNTDAFTRIRENVQYYFVPFQALWKYFEQSVNNMTSGDAGQNISKFAKSSTEADTISTSMPYINYSFIKDMIGAAYNLAVYAFNDYVTKFRTSVDSRSATDFLAWTQGDIKSSTSSGIEYKSIFQYGTYRYVRMAKLLTAFGYGNFSSLVQYDIFAMGTKYIQDTGSWNMQKFNSNNEYSLNLNVYDAFAVTNAPNLSLFPLLAYHKIINDHYRNEKWQPFEPWTCNIDYLTPGSNMNANSYLSVAAMEQDATTLFDLDNTNFPIDYFTGVLPRAQYGDEAAVNISVDGVATLNGSTGNVETWRWVQSKVYEANNVTGAGGTLHAATDSQSAVTGLLFTGETNEKAVRIENPHLHSLKNVKGDVLGDGALKISALRSATALQKYKEIQNSNDPDFSSQVLAHFGIKPHCDSRTSLFIGGDDKTISINPQVNTNLQGDAEPQIKAIGVGDLSAGCKYTSSTYGMIIGLYRAVPQLDYAQTGIDRNLYKTDASDFPIPELDSIGMQTQYRTELSAPQIGICYGLDHGSPRIDSASPIDMSATYGYAARYAELKTSYDSFEGGFFGTYSSWVTGYDDRRLGFWRSMDSSKYYLNFSDILKVTPSVLYPIFLNQWSGTVNDDKLLIGSVNTCVAVRPFSVHGLPYSK